MKQKKQLWLIPLAAEAALCVILAVFPEASHGAFRSVITFPLVQLAACLRWLSLSGTAGNTAAVALYVLLSISPLILLLYLWRRSRARGGDALLVLLSALLFAALYLLINPALLSRWLHGMTEHAGAALLGSCFYSVLLSWLLLRVLAGIQGADLPRLTRALSRLLALLAAYFVLLAFGIELGELAAGLQDLAAGTNAASDPMMDGTALILRYGANAAAYLMDLYLIFLSRVLLWEIGRDQYSEAAATAAERLAKHCRTVLVIQIILSLGVNLLQLLFAGALTALNTVVYLPVPSMIFVLATLLAARFFRENKQLKDENDSFI